MGGPPVVQGRALTKRFGSFVAVDRIDFGVERGEAFGFLGPNGAGKSSTMRMIGCVSPVSDGELRVLGLDPASDGPAIRSRIGVVPQEDNLDTELTVWDNLMIYGRALPEKAPLRFLPPRNRAHQDGGNPTVTSAEISISAGDGRLYCDSMWASLIGGFVFSNQQDQIRVPLFGVDVLYTPTIARHAIDSVDQHLQHAVAGAIVDDILAAICCPQ